MKKIHRWFLFSIFKTKKKKHKNTKSVLHTSINGSVIRMFPNAEMTSKIWCVFSWFIRKFTICDCFDDRERRTDSKGGLNGWYFHCTWKSREKHLRKLQEIMIGSANNRLLLLSWILDCIFSSILHAMWGFLIQMPHFRSINRYESWIIHTFKATPAYLRQPFEFLLASK